MTILIGDNRETLTGVATGSVQCCVTSPPYWGQRAYGGGEREIGAEKTPQEYVDTLVGLFREVRRILRDDGTCWVNIGSKYSSEFMESDELLLRDDLTTEERVYVLSEMADVLKSEAVSMREADESPE